MRVIDGVLTDICISVHSWYIQTVSDWSLECCCMLKNRWPS